MPHSSGGGSHGGGSHGGSHGGRSGGGSSAPRVSTTRFVGSRRYSYYDKNNVKQYIYCAQDPAKAFKPHWWLLLFYVPFLFAVVVMLSEVVHIPFKVDNPDGYILIEDNAELIEDENKLALALSRFYNDTGVTPAVITTFHSVWEKNYSSLEKYAYDLYVNKFRDEKHWLIVYSKPERPDANGFVNWKWEGMIGNDVGSAITYRDENYLTTEMQKNLSASSRLTPEEAIAVTFDSVSQNAMKVSFDFSMLLPALFVLAFVVVHAALMIGLTPKNLRYSKAVYDPEPKDLPVTCNYCRSTFILNDNTSCPNCGAPLELSQTASAT